MRSGPLVDITAAPEGGKLIIFYIRRFLERG